MNADTPDDELLARLLALNLQRASEGAGKPESADKGQAAGQGAA
ncbi:hypothetical protein [Hydrogenophaga crassostreae]|nr:hypothetical protein [Hydrogenophaga crassostreae]